MLQKWIDLEEFLIQDFNEIEAGNEVRSWEDNKTYSIGDLRNQVQHHMGEARRYADLYLGSTVSALAGQLKHFFKAQKEIIQEKYQVTIQAIALKNLSLSLVELVVIAQDPVPFNVAYYDTLDEVADFLKASIGDANFNKDISLKVTTARYFTRNQEQE